MTTVHQIKLPPKGSFSSCRLLNAPKAQDPISNPRIHQEKTNFPEEIEEKEDQNSLELTEMFEFAQQALKKTSEVQDDINKLFKYWETQESSNELRCLDLANKLLIENNLKPLGPSPTLKKTLKLVINLIAEVKVLRESLAERLSNPSDLEIDSLKKKVKSLKNQDLNEISFQVEEPFLEKIKKTLQVEEEEEIFSKIESLKNIMKVVPSLDIFVQEICKEIVPGITDNEDYQSFAFALKEVFPRVRALKAAIEELTEFKVQVFQALNLQISSSDEDALEKVKSVAYFEKLFEVDRKEDIFDVMEKLFLYHRESKGLMEKLRKKLNVKQGISGFLLIDELKRVV
jgi:hypothetical protein